MIFANETVPLRAPAAIAADFTLLHSAQVIYKPSYSPIKLSSTNDASDPKVHLQRIEYYRSMLPGLGAWDTAYAVLAGGENMAMNAERPIKDYDPFYSADGTRYGDAKNVVDHLPIPPQMGGRLADNTGDLHIFFEAGVLQDVVGTYYWQPSSCTEGSIKKLPRPALNPQWSKKIGW